jgi:hypothetical protein
LRKRKVESLTEVASQWLRQSVDGEPPVIGQSRGCRHRPGGRRVARHMGEPHDGVGGDEEWLVVAGIGEVHAVGMADGVDARGSTSVSDFTWVAAQHRSGALGE